MNNVMLKKLAGLLALPVMLAAAVPSRAQGLPAAPGTFVQLQLSTCGTTVLRAQGTIDEDCSFNLAPGSQGTSGAIGSNLGGILRGNTDASVSQVNLVASSSTHWDDRFTYLGGALPTTAVFNFQLFGTFLGAVSGPSTAAINEVLYRAFVRPFGSWGTSDSFADGTLNVRQIVQTAGPALNEFVPVLQGLTLPVSLSGIAVGNSLDLSMSMLLQSQASAGRGGLADAGASFSNSAGLVDLRFYDALGADITSQVQWSSLYGTQFVAAVPEAATLWLMLGGLAGVAGRRLARRRRPSAGPALTGA